MAIGGFVVGCVIYNLLDDGIANCLGLETLRHGTQLTNYLSIRIFGGDPREGGKKTGSTQFRGDRPETSGQALMVDRAKNFFFVFKDNETFDRLRNNEYPRIKRIFGYYPFIKRLLPRMHAVLSGYGSAIRLFSGNSHTTIIQPVRQCMVVVGVTFNLTVTPTLRFRFAKIDDPRFIDDPDYHGLAYKTAQKIEAWRIGLFGSLFTGINLGWASRFKSNPMKVFTGVIQLTSAVALSVLFSSTLAANPALIIPVAIGMLLG